MPKQKRCSTQHLQSFTHRTFYRIRGIPLTPTLGTFPRPGENMDFPRIKKNCLTRGRETFTGLRIRNSRWKHPRTDLPKAVLPKAMLSKAVLPKAVLQSTTAVLPRAVLPKALLQSTTAKAKVHRTHRTHGKRDTGTSIGDRASSRMQSMDVL